MTLLKQNYNVIVTWNGVIYIIHDYSTLASLNDKSLVLPYLMSESSCQVVSALAISSNKQRPSTVTSIITKCEIDVPISNHDPVFLTKNKKFRHIMLQQINRMMKNFLSSIFVIEMISLTAHMTNSTGMMSLMMMSEAIKNGAKVDTKHLTQFGSNELTDAILPVPNNDVKIYSRLMKARLNSTISMPEWLLVRLSGIEWSCRFSV